MAVIFIGVCGWPSVYLFWYDNTINNNGISDAHWWRATCTSDLSRDPSIILTDVVHAWYISCESPSQTLSLFGTQRVLVYWWSIVGVFSFYKENNLYWLLVLQSWLLDIICSVALALRVDIVSLAATRRLQQTFFCCVCPSVRLSVCPSVRLSVCPSVRLSVCPSVRLSVCPSVRLSFCPSVRRASPEDAPNQ